MLLEAVEDHLEAEREVFMVAALEDESAIVGRQTASARSHAAPGLGALVA